VAALPARASLCRGSIDADDHKISEQIAAITISGL